MSRGSNVGESRWPHGGLHSLVNTTSTGAGTAFALGGSFGVFGIQITKSTGGSEQSEAEVQLQGSLNGRDWTRLGATNAWSTSKNTGTLVQVKSSAPVTHARLVMSKNTSTNAIDGYFCCLPAVST